MKMRLPRRRVWRLAIYIVSTLLVALAVDLVLVRMGRRVVVSRETTRITAPLLADGRVDYLTALEEHFGAGVTSENNAAPLVLSALGPEALPRNQPRDGITSRLGMAPLPDKGEYFQQRDAYLEKAGAAQSDPANDLEPLLKHPWKAAEHPRTAAWLAANRKPLELIAQASQRPRFYIPFNGGSPPELLGDLQLPHLKLMRDAGRALVCRAMMKAGDGDFAGARDDLLTVHRFASLLGRGSTLIDRLVGCAIDNLASSGEAAIAIEGRIDAAQARRWMEAMRELPAVPNFDEVIETGERYFFLDIVQYASRHGMYQMRVRLDPQMREAAKFLGVDKPLSGPSPLQDLVPVNISRVMREGNKWYDEFAIAMQKPTGPARREALDAVKRQFEALDSAGEPWHTMQSWGWPALTKSTQHSDTTLARRNLARVAMGLAAEHAEKRAFPATLDAFGAAATDPFSEKPLLYRPAAAGYTLYSVGPNAKDDNGGGDDIAIGPATID